MGAAESVPETSIHEFTVKVRRSPSGNHVSLRDPFVCLPIFVKLFFGEFSFSGAGLQRQGGEPGDLQGQGSPRC